MKIIYSTHSFGVKIFKAWKCPSLGNGMKSDTRNI